MNGAIYMRNFPINELIKSNHLLPDNWKEYLSENNYPHDLFDGEPVKLVLHATNSAKNTLYLKFPHTDAEYKWITYSTNGMVMTEILSYGVSESLHKTRLDSILN